MISPEDGPSDGASVGGLVGVTVGTSEGVFDGTLLGRKVGTNVGLGVPAIGENDAVGDRDGVDVGEPVGRSVAARLAKISSSFDSPQQPSPPQETAKEAQAPRGRRISSFLRSSRALLSLMMRRRRASTPCWWST